MSRVARVNVGVGKVECALPRGYSPDCMDEIELTVRLRGYIDAVGVYDDGGTYISVRWPEAQTGELSLVATQVEKERAWREAHPEVDA